MGLGEGSGQGNGGHGENISFIFFFKRVLQGFRGFVNGEIHLNEFSF